MYIALRSVDVTLPLSDQNYNRDYESDSNTIIISSSSDNEENLNVQRSSNIKFNLRTDQTNIQETMQDRTQNRNSVYEFSTNTLRQQPFNVNILRQYELLNTQRNSNTELNVNGSQDIRTGHETNTLQSQQFSADILRLNDINLNRSNTHQVSADLVNDSNLILNTKEFRIQHLNSLRIAYGISDHETIRITIKDRSSITDDLLN